MRSLLAEYGFDTHGAYGKKVIEVNTYLTIPEIQELTGYTYRRLQCEHLDKIDIPYHCDRFGNPKVYRAKYEVMEGDKYYSPEPSINLKAMKEAINGQKAQN